METFTIHTKNKEQSRIIKAFLKALKIPFQSSEENPYDPEFVAKIKESEVQAREGKVKAIKTDELWK
ncbi:DUF2683 family protein [Sinomicrobium soli]|uniref:DUF2683 family protein n=1 Tax=Sinomicrobium sp. N-1-3-6 TaxID=2219864 RepID=UPI000DCC6BD2|nr:DUF2683 family protein [Sinomicrobium sp. N-1-3-6]RAV30726.1 hypothetical protein DN748_00240 [Sinomicrobium sp. N-1-3-6]